MEKFDEILKKYTTPGGVPMYENVFGEILEQLEEPVSPADKMNLASLIFDINKPHVKKLTYNRVYDLIEKTSGHLEEKKKNYASRSDITMFTDGSTHAMMYKEKTKIANFTLSPLYKVSIEGENRYYYLMTDYSGRQTTVYFTQNLLSSDKNLINNHIAKVCMSEGSVYENRSEAMITSLIENMRDKFVQKEATGHVGLVMKKGKYYAVGPKKAYDVESGEETEEIVYSPSVGNATIVSQYKNMEYDRKEFPKIARVYGENSWQMNELMNTAIINGFFHSLVHEYVFRSLGNSSFPPLFVTGLPESGKSSVMNAVKPYMGYGDNVKTAEIPLQTQQSIINTLMNSYNIPRFLDEYGKEADAKKNKCSVTEANDVIAAASNKTGIARGQAGGGNIESELTNPVVAMGQFSPSDRFLVTRSVEIKFDYAYIMNPDQTPTEQGACGKEALSRLLSNENKNYYMGMLITQRQMYDNDAIKRLYKYYMRYVRKNFPRSNRKSEAMVVIMVGLHCYIQMMKKLGVKSIGYTLDTIKAIPAHIIEAKEKSESEETELEKFMAKLDDYATATATDSTKSSRAVFGVGKFIFVDTAPYTIFRRKKNKKMESEKSYNMKDDDVVYINVQALHNSLSQYAKDIPNLDQIKKQIEQEFIFTTEGRGNTILAPMGYEYRNRKMYTIFNKQQFYDKFFDVEAKIEEIEQANALKR